LQATFRHSAPNVPFSPGDIKELWREREFCHERGGGNADEKVETLTLQLLKVGRMAPSRNRHAGVLRPMRWERNVCFPPNSRRVSNLLKEST